MSFELFRSKEGREKREALDLLEATTHLISQRKILIIATYLGLKPLSLIEADVEATEDENAVREEMETIARGLGLHLEELGTTPYTGDVQGKEIEYAIAKRKEAIENFRTKMEDISVASSDYDRVFGRLMGFPHSAIVGFAEDDPSTWKEAKKHMTDEERKFLFFRPSKDYWEEELVWLRQIIEGVRRVSPKIYDEVMEYKLGGH